MPRDIKLDNMYPYTVISDADLAAMKDAFHKAHPNVEYTPIRLLNAIANICSVSGMFPTAGFPAAYPEQEAFFRDVLTRFAASSMLIEDRTQLKQIIVSEEQDAKNGFVRFHVDAKQDPVHIQRFLNAVSLKLGLGAAPDFAHQYVLKTAKHQKHDNEGYASFEVPLDFLTLLDTGVQPDGSVTLQLHDYAPYLRGQTRDAWAKNINMLYSDLKPIRMDSDGTIHMTEKVADGCRRWMASISKVQRHLDYTKFFTIADYTQATEGEIKTHPDLYHLCQGLHGATLIYENDDSGSLHKHRIKELQCYRSAPEEVRASLALLRPDVAELARIDGHRLTLPAGFLTKLMGEADKISDTLSEQGPEAAQAKFEEIRAGYMPRASKIPNEALPEPRIVPVTTVVGSKSSEELKKKSELRNQLKDFLVPLAGLDGVCDLAARLRSNPDGTQVSHQKTPPSYLLPPMPSPWPPEFRKSGKPAYPRISVSNGESVYTLSFPDEQDALLASVRISMAAGNTGMSIHRRDKNYVLTIPERDVRYLKQYVEKTEERIQEIKATYAQDPQAAEQLRDRLLEDSKDITEVGRHTAAVSNRDSGAIAVG